MKDTKVGQLGGNTEIGPTETGPRPGEEAEATADAASKVAFFTKHRRWVGAAAAALLALLLTAQWSSLPPAGRYVLPVSQDDWAAWGTWAGAIGAIAAVVFAAQSIKQAIEAQQTTERELKADRQHDRDEREKERQLVREERAELKQEHDQIALHKASQLTFVYSWSPPHDHEYEAVHNRSLEEDAKLSALLQEGHLPPSYDGPDELVHDNAFVVIRNGSKDVTFEELALWLPEEHLEVTQIHLFERETPPRGLGEQMFPGEPPEWNLCTTTGAALPLGTKQYMLGSIKPRGELMVKLTFSTPQSNLDWSTSFHASDYETPPQAVRHVLLGYRDQQKRHWIRSTRSAKDVPFRLLDFDEHPLTRR